MSKKEHKKETLEEAAERLQKDKYGIFISKDAEVKGQLVIDTARAAFLSGMTEGAKWQQDMADNWLTMKEGDITVNFKPMPEFDEPAYPNKLHQLQIQAAEACFRKYPNNGELYPTEELKDAYKAGVIDGLREWRLDSYDKSKYPEVKIICPRCKTLMPCECNKSKSLIELMKPYSDIMNSNWDTIFTDFHLATQQVEIGAPPLIFECWLVDNYNPPIKKQDNSDKKYSEQDVQNVLDGFTNEAPGEYIKTNFIGLLNKE